MWAAGVITTKTTSRIMVRCLVGVRSAGQTLHESVKLLIGVNELFSHGNVYERRDERTE